MTDHFSVFISYSWDNEDHKAWIRHLAAKLVANGVSVSLDQWDLVPGDSVTQFMENGVANSKFVLVVCTPNYASKSARRAGGVGYEQQIITGEILAQSDRRKFVPIIRAGSLSGDDGAIPPHFSGVFYVDMRSSDALDHQLETLLRVIYKKPLHVRPASGPIPDFARPVNEQNHESPLPSPPSLIRPTSASPETNAAITWQKTDQDDRSIWTNGQRPLVVNTGFGTEKIKVKPAPRGYARLIPTSWSPLGDPVAELQAPISHPWPLGDASGLSWGRASGGLLAWRVDRSSPELNEKTSVTRWFRATGEFWGLANEFFYSPADGERRVATTYLLRRWHRFLQYHAELLKRIGGTGPFHCILGITALEDSLWPPGAIPFQNEEVEAVEASMEYKGTFQDPTDKDLRAQVKAAADLLRDAFGFPPYSDDHFDLEFG